MSLTEHFETCLWTIVSAIFMGVVVTKKQNKTILSFESYK